MEAEGTRKVKAETSNTHHHFVFHVSRRIRHRLSPRRRTQNRELSDHHCGSCSRLAQAKTVACSTTQGRINAGIAARIVCEKGIFVGRPESSLVPCYAADSIHHVLPTGIIIPDSPL
jgi:hypothetical protein